MLGLLVLALILGLFGWTLLDDGDGDGPSATTVTKTFVKGERTWTISTMDLTSDSTAAAELVDPPAAARGISPRTLVGDDDVRVSLSQPAPRPVEVRVVVSGIRASGSALDDISNLWLTFALAITGIFVLMCAYLLSHVSATGKVLFAAFTKVTGLILVAIIGLAAAIIASSAADAEQFTALFTLLGLIAGYLAGTKTGDQDELAVGRTPQEPGPDGREGPRPGSGPGGTETDQERTDRKRRQRQAAAEGTEAVVLKSRSLL